MPVIDWSTADIDERGRLTVKFASPSEPGLRLSGTSGQDEHWARAFESLVRSHEGQVRGRNWGRVELMPGAITVGDVREGAEQDLRQYLQELGGAADERALQLRQQHEQVQKQAADAERESHSRAERMTRRIRGD
jgi:hypothetical protein